MKLTRLLLFAAVALFAIAYDTRAQDEDICTERGIVNTDIETPVNRFFVVFGRVTIRRPKGEVKAPTVVVWLREGRSTQKYSFEGSGSYCFIKGNAGGELTVDINGQEQGRRPIITNIGQQREDFDFTMSVSQKPVPPGVISAKFNYPRKEKNARRFEDSLKAEAEQKPEKAIEYLTEIVNSDPADYVAQAKIGSIYYRQKKYSDAETWFTRSVATNPEYSPAWITLAQSQYAQQKYESAMESCKKVIKLDAKSAVAFYILGETYLRMQKGNEAVDALNEAIKLDPIRMAECHLIIADLYDSNGLKKLASKEYKAFLEKVPDHPEKQRFEQYIKDNPQ